MTFEEWVIREGGYLNDSDPEAKTARRIALRAWQAALASAPTWHDAPTEPGLWVRSANQYTGPVVLFAEQIPVLRGGAARWYGPIPQDKEGGAA